MFILRTASLIRLKSGVNSKYLVSLNGVCAVCYCICGRYRCPSNQDVEYEEIETKCLTDVVNNAQEAKGGCSHGPYLDANVTVKHVIRVCRTMFNKAKHRV